MAYYKPCKNCAADTATCPRRTEVAKAIFGLSVTVVNFRCLSRKEMFRPGQRVEFHWIDYGDGQFEEDAVSLLFHGTVMEERGLRFIVRVDDTEDARGVFKSDSLVIKVKPSDMHALDEPDRPMCPSCCGYPGEKSRCQGWGNPGSLESYWPVGCLVRQSQNAEINKPEAEEVF